MTETDLQIDQQERATSIRSELGIDPRPLDPRIINVWRIQAAMESAVALVIGLVAATLLWQLDLHLALAALPLALAVFFVAFNIGVLPQRRWRSWRYAIGEAEIELRHGIWWHTWTRIPMNRVQHVDTRRGPLERRYGLASLVVYTAAGARQIPGLALVDAERSRDRIAELANVRDDV